MNYKISNLDLFIKRNVFRSSKINLRKKIVIQNDLENIHVQLKPFIYSMLTPLGNLESDILICHHLYILILLIHFIAVHLFVSVCWRAFGCGLSRPCNS